MTSMDAFTDLATGIALETWNIFLDTAPYLFFGFGVAGLLHIFISDDKIINYLGAMAGKIRSVVNASIVGIPLPICSCGIVPAAISLRQRGATRGATLSFLISTPATGVDSIAVTYALLDPIMTVFRPIAAFVTALAAGIADNLLVKDKEDSVGSFHANPSCSSCCDHSKSEIHGFTHRILMGIRYAYLELPGEISRWLIFGIFLAGVISYMIPDSLINQHLNGGLSSMIIMLLVGIPLYICATASTPLAAAMIAKGASPGAAFVFLLAGPATNIATITMVTRFLGMRSALLYLAMIAIISVTFGLFLDFFYLKMGVATTSIAGSASDLVSQEVKTVFAFLMVLIIAYAIIRPNLHSYHDANKP